MAIYHLSVKPIQRSKGRSSTGASAYRAGVCLHDERTGEVHDYTRKRGVEYSEIITPSGENIDREELWNMAEKAEKRKDGTPAREYEVALPSELNAEQRKELAREFAQDLSKRHGCAVDVAIHEPNRKGDERNYHAHILCTTRQFQEGKLGKKCDVELSDRDRIKKGLEGRRSELEMTRNIWSKMANSSLEKSGHEERISHESLEKQGINKKPTVHLGPNVTAMERRGIQTDRGDLNRENHEEPEKELKEQERIQTGVSTARSQARMWRMEQERARIQAVEIEKAKVKERDERERQKKERKQQEVKEQQKQERSKSRSPSMGR